VRKIWKVVNSLLRLRNLPPKLPSRLAEDGKPVTRAEDLVNAQGAFSAEVWSKLCTKLNYKF
jgi:hypothetical protein